MQISVECGGFTRAADACLTANQTAALLTTSLGARLAGHGGMAGNDSTGTTFARAYDDGARAGLDALTDLTHAFIGAGRLLTMTGEHHGDAEGAAAGLRVSAYAGATLEDDFVRVRPAAVPSSLGAQQPSLGVIDAWILDQVEGFVWPGADVEVLRTAAGDWRRAAGSAAGLADHVDAAVALVELQRSPEVPLAVDALTDLRTLVGDTAWELSRLADACEEHAAAVEDTRARTRALLTEIAQMVVEGAAISVLVAGATGGLGGGAAAAAAAARVRTQAPRFYALLVALRHSAATSAARLEHAAAELVRVRSRVERFLRVPARGERGSMRPPGGWTPRVRGPGWLRDHEVPPGHTIERHVGRSADQLAQRLTDNRALSRVSTFDDQLSAESLIGDLLDRHAEEVAAWASSGRPRMSLVEEIGVRTGTTLERNGSLTTPTGIRVVLVADPTARSGWRILTAFPD
jgi:hypothetical protein